MIHRSEPCITSRCDAVSTPREPIDVDVREDQTASHPEI